MFHCLLVDCNWNIWGSWGSCTKTCDSGSRTRTRSKNGPFYGGIDCSGSLSESSSCNTNSCPGKHKLMNVSLFKYINMCSYLVYSGLHMAPLGILELMLKDMWLRYHDSLKDPEWTILWRKCLHRIIVRVNFLQYK